MMSNVTSNTVNDTSNGLARASAISAGNAVEIKPAALVGYSSSGSVFIIGPEKNVRQAASRLSRHSQLHCTLVFIENSQEIASVRFDIQAGNNTASGIELPAAILGRLCDIHGYLGNFQISLQTTSKTININQLPGIADNGIDIILDLSSPAFIASELKPPGYFAAESDESALQNALDEIPGLVGDFEKPQYFNYDPDICAHSRSNIVACTKCIDTCPTDAIISIGDRIGVDANLCQGAGSCATACPTGAITYNYPLLQDNLRRIHSMLTAYHGAGGQDSVILLHDAASGRQAVDRASNRLPGNVIPIELEEIGSMGMDGWLSCLVYGAKSVCLLSSRDTPASVIVELQQQLQYTGAILEGMNLPKEIVRLISDDEFEHFQVQLSQALCNMPVAEFIESNNKRNIIDSALDHLAFHTQQQNEVASLTAGAPFGEISVDSTRCTLCMSCVWQCPANALIAGGNQPQLKFVEGDCVQCGMCASSCPENAITLVARYLYGKKQRRAARVLYEEQPFFCIKCGKAFASQSMIDQITAKLKQHSMFQGDAIRRIQMCEDCRVKDIYESERKQNDNVFGEIT